MMPLPAGISVLGVFLLRILDSRNAFCFGLACTTGSLILNALGFGRHPKITTTWLDPSFMLCLICVSTSRLLSSPVYQPQSTFNSLPNHCHRVFWPIRIAS